MASVPVVVPRFPPIVSGSRPGGGGRGKEGSSPGGISSGIGTGGEVRNYRVTDSEPGNSKPPPSSFPDRGLVLGDVTGYSRDARNMVK